MTPRALRFARFEKVEDYLRQGWMVSIPNAAMHHHYYGVELKWICNCPVPGGFKTSSNRVPRTATEENADDGRGPQLERATEVDC